MCYTGQEIEYDALHIDHVINKSLVKDSILRDKTLVQLNLPLNFNIYGIKNLVPTTSTFNLKKNHRDIPITEKIKILDKANEISKKVGNFWETNDLNGRAQRLSDNLSLSSNEADKKNVAEKLYRTLTDLPPSFEIGTSIGGDYIRISTSNVYLMSYLPIFPDYVGSMMIVFNDVKLSGATFSFGHKDIVNVLFSGIKTSPKLKARKFIVGFDTERNGYWIQMGTVRFFLCSEICLELCSAIDDLAKEYLNRIWKSETEVYQSIDFQKSKENRFRLLKIPEWVWHEIVIFVMNHDHESGDSAWHIFDSNPEYIKVFLKSDAKHKKDYRVFIYPEADLPAYAKNLSDYKKELWLCWDTSFAKSLGRNEVSYRRNTVWQVSETYEWLIDQLLPEVLQRSEKPGLLAKLLRTQQSKRISSDDCRKKFAKSIGVKIYYPSPANIAALIENIQNILTLVDSFCLIPSDEILEAVNLFKAQMLDLENHYEPQLKKEVDLFTADEHEDKPFWEGDYAKSAVNRKFIKELKDLICQLEGLPISSHEKLLANISAILQPLYKWYKYESLISKLGQS